ncbi:MAG: hypothetical protein IPM91_10440 [Bacteroidetes bacterium]|nr:hypothetical protein [Bacteroidota bacterium]
MKKYIYLILLWLIAASSGFAQMVQQNESFESATPGAPAIFPSPGWKQIRFPSTVTASFVVQSVATTTNPTCGASPGGGTNVMMFSSYSGCQQRYLVDRYQTV